MKQLPGQISLFNNKYFNKDELIVIKSALSYYIADLRVKKSCYKGFSKDLDHPQYLEVKDEEEKACKIYDSIKNSN